MTRAFLAALGVLVALVLAGCAGTTAAGGGGPRLVASTNVYADIARSIGGDRVTVDALIDDPDRDPHDFEPSTRDRLRVSKANIVVENGGGYDDFVGRMLAADGGEPVVLNVTTLSGKDAKAEDFNEHLWYDLPTMRLLAARLVKAFSAADPGHTEEYRARGEAFTKRIDALAEREKELAARYRGVGVAITEPVPLYLLAAVGLENRTPPAFSEAVEEGSDAAPAVVERTLGLFEDHEAALLAYNTQTDDAQTRLVLDAAKKAGVPVVPVSETLPAHEHYADWIGKTLDAVSAALEQGGTGER